MTGVKEQNARHEDGGVVSGSAILGRAAGAGLSTMGSSGARRNKEVHRMENQEKRTPGRGHRHCSGLANAPNIVREAEGQCG